VPTHPLNVLFLCTGNSARSIMAEAILNRLGRPKFRAFSAGSQPAGEIRPPVIELLRRQTYAVDDLASKDWSTFSGPDAPELTFVFTLCDQAAAETCPVWPGQPMTAHWGMPDPAAVSGTEAEVALAYADAYRMLHQRIDIFTNLPLADLEPVALQQRLNEIGAGQHASPAPALTED
jgi:protein-tyrosine-phosphatase